MWKKQFEDELKELREEINLLKKDSHNSIYNGCNLCLSTSYEYFSLRTVLLSNLFNNIIV